VKKLEVPAEVRLENQIRKKKIVKIEIETQNWFNFTDTFYHFLSHLIGA